MHQKSAFVEIQKEIIIMLLLHITFLISHEAGPFHHITWRPIVRSMPLENYVSDQTVDFIRSSMKSTASVLLCKFWSIRMVSLPRNHHRATWIQYRRSCGGCTFKEGNGKRTTTSWNLAS